MLVVGCCLIRDKFIYSEMYNLPRYCIAAAPAPPRREPLIFQVIRGVFTFCFHMCLCVCDCRNFQNKLDICSVFSIVLILIILLSLFLLISLHLTWHLHPFARTCVHLDIDVWATANINDDDDDDGDGGGRRKVMLSNCVKWVIFVLVAFRRWVLTSLYTSIYNYYLLFERVQKSKHLETNTGNSNRKCKMSNWTKGLKKILAKLYMNEWKRHANDSHCHSQHPTEPNKRRNERTYGRTNKQTNYTFMNPFNPYVLHTMCVSECEWIH